MRNKRNTDINNNDDDDDDDNFFNTFLKDKQN